MNKKSALENERKRGRDFWVAAWQRSQLFIVEENYLSLKDYTSFL